MVLFVDSVGHYTTAQISGKYTTATSVTVVPGAGRLGGQAILFDASIPAVLTKTLSPSAFAAGGNLLTVGFAYQPITLFPTYLATLVAVTLSDASTWKLKVNAAGQLGIYINDLLSTCVSPVNTVKAGVGGYLEVQFNASNGHGVAEAFIRWNAVQVAHGTMANHAAATYSSVTFGNGSAEQGTWYLCDLYMNDGNATLPVGGVTRLDGSVVTPSGFLGNISVQCILPTNNGLNLFVSNTAWVPELNGQLGGVANWQSVNTQFATDQVSTLFNGGFPTGNLDSFQCTSPRAGAVLAAGLYGFNGGVPWPVYGVQWVARVKSNGAVPHIATVVRRVVGGTIPTDTVALGSPQAISSVSYLFAVVPFSGDPTNSNQAWQYDKSFLEVQAASQTGDVEFGIQKIAGVA